ncbi:hypothetical protein GGR52DRAFT_577682 [Hypoxylon sp. FL1284]|nr:hypothetical protein GGR52DRAFT_577682 [Hypoxylon sp. FL1284]
MAKLSLRLVTVLLSFLLRTALGVTLDQLFVIRGGTSNSGCDNYFDPTTKEGTLNDWHEEIIYSVAAAIDGIDRYRQEPAVRKALVSFFGIPNRARPTPKNQERIDKIAANLKSVHDFFGLELIGDGQSAGQPIYPLNNDRFLFCGSDFLERETPGATAKDFEGKDIQDDEGNAVTIADVPGYTKALSDDAGSSPWWAGDPINGYYFSSTGGDYCSDKNLGLTSSIEQLKGENGRVTTHKHLDSVYLCGYSFTDPERPESYRAGDGQIQQNTRLAHVVPRSATLLHEAFHLLFGADDGKDPQNPKGFLQGDEIYDFGECVDAAKKNNDKVAMRNPENYVFFVASMYYLFGESDPDGASSSIDVNWEFNTIRGDDGNYFYGAWRQIS